MLPGTHVFVSSVVATGLYAYQGEPLPAVVCFFVGWVADVDHFYDYFHQYGLETSISRIYRYHKEKKVNGFHAFLHGWEYFLLFVILYISTNYAHAIGAAALGYGLHLTLDEITNNKRKPFTYFLLYRLIHGFDREYF